MTAPRTNLLSFTQAVLKWASVLVVIVGVTAAAMMLAVVFGGGESFYKTDPSANLTPAQVRLGAKVAFVAAVIGSVLAFLILRHLIAIVGTARRGDPFVPANAARLRRIGWMLLVINCLIAITVWMAGRRGINLDLTSLVTTLLVFVLARIFEVGTRMRSDLQGTV